MEEVKQQRDHAEPVVTAEVVEPERYGLIVSNQRRRTVVNPVLLVLVVKENESIQSVKAVRDKIVILLDELSRVAERPAKSHILFDLVWPDIANRLKRWDTSPILVPCVVLDHGSRLVDRQSSRRPWVEWSKLDP